MIQLIYRQLMSYTLYFNIRRLRFKLTLKIFTQKFNKLQDFLFKEYDAS